jgi:hypothetical protein
MGEHHYNDYAPKGYVFVNGNYVPIDTVEVLDISEDFLGRDLVKFKYQGKELESYVVVK